MQHMLRMGIDVGSTTVKVVLLDEHDNYLYKKYIRHYANILDTVYTLLQEAQVGHEDALVHVCITGSGGMAMAEKVRIPFVQEVIAETRAVKALYPETDVIIELGGEDAKVTYLGQTAEHRMNGSCAGGTGAFIDQMATLLQTDASGLNQLAMNADTIYPIAARCGVFAKTDVQALLNQGASHENIAKSVFQAIVNQTIAGLACGHKIEGNVAFLGGPLTFLSELRQCFCDTLELDEAHRIIPENGVRYTVPSTIRLSHMKNTQTVRFRVGREYRNVKVCIYADDQLLRSLPKKTMAPGEMENIILMDKDMVKKDGTDVARIRIAVEE